MRAMNGNPAFDDEPAVTVLPPIREPTFIDESNHRIANSLQLLVAMAAAESRGIGDPAARAALERMQWRIDAIANVHRQLYRSREAGALDLGDYLEELAGNLETGAGHGPANRRVYVSAEAVQVSPEIATGVGIVVSEVVSNACKYAYPKDVPGDIWLSLRSLPLGGYRLAVEDRGRGLSDQIRGSGLGGRLIAAMSARLGASHLWEAAHPGTRFVMEARQG
jgi:two-component sensor histidine kinase